MGNGMNRYTYTITPRGEVKLELPGHTIYLNETRAQELEHLLANARHEQRRHPTDVHRLRQEAMQPEELARDMTRNQRKGLRRASRGQRIGRTQYAELHEIKLLHAGQLTRRAHQILEALNRQR